MIQKISEWIILNYNNIELRIVLQILLLVILGKLFVAIIDLIFKYLDSRKKSNIDYKIFGVLERPLYYLILVVGLKIIIETNQLFLNYEMHVVNIYNSLLYLILGLLIVKTFDASLIQRIRNSMFKSKTISSEKTLSLYNRLFSIAVFLILSLLILTQWGFEVGPLFASLGIAAVAIAFALQKTLSNIFGGISLVLDKNISVGDVIDINNEGKKVGTVVDIGIRSTKIKTFDNEILIIPSGELSESSFINRAKPNLSIRVVIPFSVAYGSDIDSVKKVVFNEIKKIDDLKLDEEISIKFLEMAESSLNFKAFFYVNDYKNRFSAIDQGNTLIYNTLRKNKISIPFPQMDVHLKR